MYIYIEIYTFTCVYIHICTCVHIYICIGVYLHICMHVSFMLVVLQRPWDRFLNCGCYQHLGLCAIWGTVFRPIPKHIHMYIYIYTYICIYIYTYVFDLCLCLCLYPCAQLTTVTIVAIGSYYQVRYENDGGPTKVCMHNLIVYCRCIQRFAHMFYVYTHICMYSGMHLYAHMYMHMYT